MNHGLQYELLITLIGLFLILLVISHQLTQPLSTVALRVTNVGQPRGGVEF